MATTTRIDVRRQDERTVCALSSGALSPRRVRSDDARVRIALVATVALLLAGDDVRVEVHVGADVVLEVVEVAGTVAYDMRGGAASWSVDITVERGGVLLWHGQPLVLADGADVVRSTTATLSSGARAVLRETLVLGRTGEVGGDLRSSFAATYDGRPLLVEYLDLSRSGRAEPVVLGTARCLDSVTVLGSRSWAGEPGVLQLAGPGSVDRRLLASAHTSDLDGRFAGAVATFS